MMKRCVFASLLSALLGPFSFAQMQISGPTLIQGGSPVNPGGTTTQVQVNNSGAFGAVPVTIDGSGNATFGASGAGNITAGTVSPAWLAKIGYVSSAAFGGGTTNISTFFANTSNCNGSSKPCTAVADPGYANTDNPFTFSSNVYTQGPSQSTFQDLRNGSITNFMHNPAKNNFVGFNDGWTQIMVNDTIQGAAGSTANAGIRQWLWFGSPGSNLGNISFGPAGTTVNDAHEINMSVATPGISGGVDVFFTKTGIGDNHGFGTTNWSYGGSTDVSAEGNEGMRMTTGTASTQFQGTVATGGSGATTVTVNCTVDCTGYEGGPGDGRYLMLTTALASGNATARTNPSGNTPGTITIDTTVTPSTAWGTLSGNCSPASIPTPIGTGSTSTTCNVTMLSGTFSAGDHVCFSGSFHEQAILSAATGTTVTVPLRHSHVSGSWLMANGPCGSFFDPTANDLLVNGVTLKFPYDIVGATASSTLVYAWFGFGVSTNNPQLGSFFISQPAATSLLNTGGIVTLTAAGVTMATHPEYYANATLTITGAAVSAYNGQCTNTFLVAGSSFLIGCTQAGSNGAGSSATATIALGTSGYGNSAFALYNGAEVLDVQTYPSGKPGVVCPSSLCSFLLEPNSANWAASAGVMQPQHYLWHGSQIVGAQSILNSAQKDSGGWSILMTGPGINNMSAFHILNAQVDTVYTGHGGSLVPPGGLLLDQSGANTGVFNYGMKMQLAPEPNGSSAFMIGCPVSGCSDPTFLYNILQGSNASAGFSLAYRPAFDTILASSKWSFSSPLAKTTFNDNVLGSALATPPQLTATTSTSGGTLADAFTRCYTVVAQNTAGATPQSVEKCVTTGSSGSNKNSITLTTVQPQGATFYRFCGGSTGAELLMKTSVVNSPFLVSWTDDGSITPSGSCSTTNTTLPGLDQWAWLQLNNGTANTKINPGASASLVTLTLPAVTGTLALNSAFVASGASHAAGLVPDPGASAGTVKFLREDATWVQPSAASLSNGATGSGAVVLASLLTSVRAGTWTISSGTTVSVTFATAMASAPTSCSVMATSDPTTAGAIWPTTLATTGFTVNIHTAAAISGTYQCVINNAN